MTNISSQDNPALSVKRSWTDPAFELERSFVVRAQQPGPGLNSDGSVLSSLISPFGQSSDPQACP